MSTACPSLLARCCCAFLLLSNITTSSSSVSSSPTLETTATTVSTVSSSADTGTLLGKLLNQKSNKDHSKTRSKHLNLRSIPHKDVQNSTIDLNEEKFEGTRISKRVSKILLPEIYSLTTDIKCRHNLSIPEVPVSVLYPRTTKVGPRRCDYFIWAPSDQVIYLTITLVQSRADMPVPTRVGNQQHHVTNTPSAQVRPTTSTRPTRLPINPRHFRTISTADSILASENPDYLISTASLRSSPKVEDPNPKLISPTSLPMSGEKSATSQSTTRNNKPARVSAEKPAADSVPFVDQSATNDLVKNNIHSHQTVNNNKSALANEENDKDHENYGKSNIDKDDVSLHQSKTIAKSSSVFISAKTQQQLVEQPRSKHISTQSALVKEKSVKESQNLENSECPVKLVIQEFPLTPSAGNERHICWPQGSSLSLKYRLNGPIRITFVWEHIIPEYFSLNYKDKESECSHLCSDSLCLQAAQLCDGNRDCVDGSDELRLVCTRHTNYTVHAAAGVLDPLPDWCLAVAVTVIVVAVVIAVLMIKRSRSTTGRGVLLTPGALSNSTEVCRSTSGSVQESGQYDQNTSLLSSRHHGNHHSGSSPGQDVPRCSDREQLIQQKYDETPSSSNGHLCSLDSCRNRVSQPHGKRRSIKPRSEISEEFPPHISISGDGEEGYIHEQRKLQAAKQKHSLWMDESNMFRPPPNKTVYDRDSPPPPYSRIPPVAHSLDSLIPSVAVGRINLKGQESPPTLAPRSKSMSCQRQTNVITSAATPRHTASQSAARYQLSSQPPPEYHTLAKPVQTQIYGSSQVKNCQEMPSKSHAVTSRNIYNKLQDHVVSTTMSTESCHPLNNVERINSICVSSAQCQCSSSVTDMCWATVGSPQLYTPASPLTINASPRSASQSIPQKQLSIPLPSPGNLYIHQTSNNTNQAQQTSPISNPAQFLIPPLSKPTYDLTSSSSIPLHSTSLPKQKTQNNTLPLKPSQILENQPTAQPSPSTLSESTSNGTTTCLHKPNTVPHTQFMTPSSHTENTSIHKQQPELSTQQEMHSEISSHAHSSDVHSSTSQDSATLKTGNCLPC